jgi:hypothetical protein
MLTWLAIKKFLKKSWTFLRKYWQVPFLVLYTLVLAVVFRRKDSVTKVLEIQNDSYRKQLDAINDAHDQEIKKRDEILQTYKNVIDQLQKKYTNDTLELDNKKKRDIKRIVEEYSDDPDGLAMKLAEKYGFEYVNE